VKIREFIKKNR